MTRGPGGCWRAGMVEGISVREASRLFGLHRDTVRKMLAYSVPPGYRREGPGRISSGCHGDPTLRQAQDEPFTAKFQGSSATRPSASLSGSRTSTGSMVSTPRRRSPSRALRITSGSVGGEDRRCSCRCPTRRATPSVISIRDYQPSTRWRSSARCWPSAARLPARRPTTATQPLLRMTSQQSSKEAAPHGQAHL